MNDNFTHLTNPHYFRTFVAYKRNSETTTSTKKYSGHEMFSVDMYSLLRNDYEMNVISLPVFTDFVNK